MPTLAQNKKAHFDYQMLETFQAGLSLSGKMVKLLRERRINITGRFVVFQQNQLQIIGLGTEKLTENVPLLLSKREQNEVMGSLSEKGITCVLLEIYTHKRWIKAKIALAKGKKNYDKREDLKKKDLDREMRREATS